MPIPDFQTVFAPFLRFFSDGQPHSTADAHDYLADYFKLNEAERKELLPSGKQRRFQNRVAWTAAHMKKAQAVNAVGRGVYQITDRGRELLRDHSDSIRLRQLMQYPEFREFREKRTEQDETSPATGETPQEILENTFETLQAALAEDLLEKISEASPQFFEQVVVDLLIAMGYGGSRSEAGSTTRYTADGGVDGWIKEDKLGLDMIYLQAKRWKDPVGRKVVQEFAGSIEGFRAKKGVLITTSRFTEDAREYVHRIEKRIVLIDGKELSQLMIEHNVGVAEAQRYVVKKIDLDYFVEE